MRPSHDIRPHIAFYGFRGGDGGLSHVMANLINTCAENGLVVDFLMNNPQIPERNALHPDVRQVELGHVDGLRRVPPLIRYLRSVRPKILFCNREPANRAAAQALGLAGVDTRLVIRVATALTGALNNRNLLKRAMFRHRLKSAFKKADLLIANSNCVAEDAEKAIGIPAKQFRVINNPTLTDHLFEEAAETPCHRFFDPGAPPVIIGAGRLVRQKDFSTLISAFFHLRNEVEATLIILGEGKERSSLTAQADALGISDQIDFLGHVTNPFMYMARSRLFVLSSAWEGSPNVLIQALALGLPVVATDCACGPREILMDGYYGTLVPIGNPMEMAAAIKNAMKTPPDPKLSRQAAARFDARQTTREYLKAMGLLPEGELT